MVDRKITQAKMLAEAMGKGFAAMAENAKNRNQAGRITPLGPVNTETLKAEYNKNVPRYARLVLPSIESPQSNIASIMPKPTILARKSPLETHDIEADWYKDEPRGAVNATIKSLVDRRDKLYNILDTGKPDSETLAIYKDWYKDTAKPLIKWPTNDSPEAGGITNLSWVDDAASWVGNTISDGAKAVGNAIVDGASAVGGAIVDGASWVGNTITDGVQKIGGTIADGAKWVWDATKEPREQIVSGISEALMGVGIGISTIVSNTTDVFSPYIDNNYNYNKNLTFPYTINGQGRKDTSGNLLSAGQVKMGTRLTGNDNGCAWIATYNAAKFLGENYHPADIVKYYESHGGALVNGELGVNPLAVEMFFNDKGFDTTIYNLPSELDSRVNNSTTSIITYWTGSTAHTVAVEPKYGGYYIYNEDNNSTKRNYYKSIDAWRNDSTKDVDFVISLITVK